MNTKINGRQPFFWVAILTLAIAAAMFYSFHTGRSMAERYAPLMNAAAEIKFEATTAHLWFEEIISGDPFIDIQDVWMHLDLAEGYARMMLEGGESRGGKYLALNDPGLRDGIKQTLKGLSAFRAVAQERWAGRLTSGVGSGIDQRFDRIFNVFLADADAVGTGLQRLMQAQLQRFRLMQGLLMTIIGILGVFVGVVLQRHERRRVSDMLTLQESEESLRITLNSIGDGVIATDISGNITRMNPVAEQLTGWPIQEALGQALSIVFPIIDTTTRESMENPVQKVITSGETVFLSNHTTLTSRDGTEYQVADSAAPIYDDGQILGMVLVFQDVTERYRLREAAAKSEAQVHLLLNSTAEAIYGIDMMGECTFVNQSCLNMLGYKNNDELLGMRMHDLIHYKFPDGTDYPVDKCHIYRAFRERKNTHVDNEVFWRKDGSSFPAEYWSHPIFKDDICVGAVVTFLDISVKIKAEETIRRSQKMDALGKLTGGIAHDYNNLLGIIMGYAEQLNDHLGHEPKLKKNVQGILYAAERGAKLTQKLLAFARHKVADARVLDINDLLQEQRLMLEKTLTVRINLVLDLAEGVWPVWLDSGDLEDAIINMSINAMHAIDGNGMLTLRTNNVQLSEIDAKFLHLDAGDYVLLSVVDTGCGIDAETKEKVFDPFFSTKGVEGTGLGLSQVYGFVVSSAGAIKVYSEPGHGSRFSLYFPRSRHSVGELSSSASLDKASLRGTETLLVVDDEVALVGLAEDILTAQGYRVLTANDGEQALLVLEKEAVDLVISDVIMPKMDGYQLAAQIQQRYPHIKIQMVSGFADGRNDQVSNDTLNLLFKPYTSTALLAHVRKLLDGDSTKGVVHSKDRSQDMLAGRLILVVDDEEAIRELFKINLEKLGCQALLARNGDEAMALYQQSQGNKVAIDAVIIDLSMPGGLTGREVAAKIRVLDQSAKLIVASGDLGGPEMVHYQDYGFQAALAKDFDREKMRQVLEQVLGLA